MRHAEQVALEGAIARSSGSALKNQSEMNADRSVALAALAPGAKMLKSLRIRAWLQTHWIENRKKSGGSGGSPRTWSTT
jgi:hypothetical protein